MPRFKFTISDGLLLTALIASIVASIVRQETVIALITACCMLIFIWHRPVILRLWNAGMIGLGAGLFGAGCATSGYWGHLDRAEMIGWGLGILLGSIAAFVMFGVIAPRCESADSAKLEVDASER